MLEDEVFDGKTDITLDWLAPENVNDPFPGTVGFSVAYETRTAEYRVNDFVRGNILSSV